MSCQLGFDIQDLIKANRVRQDDIKTIRNYLADENLPNYSDEMLALFLMACDNKIEETKTCASQYYSSRNDCPEIFENRDLTSEEMLKQFNTIEYAVMPERTDEDYAVMVARFHDTNPWNYNMAEASKLFLMAMDSIMYSNPPKGLVLLYDMKGLGIMHLTRIHLSILKRMFHYIQEGLNVQLKTVHIINVNWLVDNLIKLVKPFMKPELLELLRLHTSGIDMNQFYEEHIPKKCLPLDYGGLDESMEDLHKKMWKRLQELEEYFKAEEQLRLL